MNKDWQVLINPSARALLIVCQENMHAQDWHLKFTWFLSELLQYSDLQQLSLLMKVPHCRIFFGSATIDQDLDLLILGYAIHPG